MKNKRVVPVKNTAGAATPDQESLPRRILVVEDDGDIRRLNTDVLISSGYHVDFAEDGAIAWETLQHKSYDLLVTDNEMPKVTGVDLLKKLHAARKAVPVIMATAALPQEEFARCPWLQPAATLLKPYTADELLGTVKEVLRATDNPPGQVELRPNWEGTPSTEGWQL